jgi:hypothetical protein
VPPEAAAYHSTSNDDEFDTVAARSIASPGQTVISPLEVAAVANFSIVFEYDVKPLFEHVVAKRN